MNTKSFYFRATLDRTWTNNSEQIAIGTLSAAAAVAVVPGYLPKSEAPAKAPTPAPVQTKKEDDLDVEKLLTWVSSRLGMLDCLLILYIVNSWRKRKQIRSRFDVINITNIFMHYFHQILKRKETTTGRVFQVPHTIYQNQLKWSYEIVKSCLVVLIKLTFNSVYITS